MGRQGTRLDHARSKAAEWLGTQLWVIPGLLVVVVLIVAVGLSILDQRLERLSWVWFPGGPSSARSLLSSIAGAMITFTGLVFSITVLVLQLASQQFSPRALRAFLRDRPSQYALGLFTATFTFALIVLRQVTTTSVPVLSVSFSVVLVVASVAMFFGYISHMANAVRASTIIQRVASETRGAIEARYEAPNAGSPVEWIDDDAEVWRARTADSYLTARTAGVLVGIDVALGVKLAGELGVTFVARPVVGDFVPQGGIVLNIVGGQIDEERHKEASEVFTIAKDRSMPQDVGFGVRQLVDIAERGLSPAVNDPTTAVQAIDQIHDLLRLMVVRRFPSNVHRDSDGDARLIVRVPTWDDLVTLAVSEIRLYGAGSLQVHRRLRAMLLDLADIAPSSRLTPIRRELHLLDESAEAFESRRSVELARGTDAQGLGS